MSKNNQAAELKITENLNPLSVDELLSHVIQDIAAGESPSLAVDEFFDEFVYRKCEEATQILMLIDMPSDAVIEGLVNLQMQAIEVIRQNAPKYLDELRTEVKARLAEMANERMNGG